MTAQEHQLSSLHVAILVVSIENRAYAAEEGGRVIGNLIAAPPEDDEVEEGEQD